MTRRGLTAAGSGTFALLLIVVVFGNPAVVRYAVTHNATRVSGRVLLVLTSFGFIVHPERDAHGWVIPAAGVLLLLSVVFALLAVVIGALRPRGGAAAAFLAGWGCTVFASALAGTVRGVLLAPVQCGGTGCATLVGLGEGGRAAMFGVLVGWLVGLACLGAYLAVRPGRAVHDTALTTPPM